MEQNVWGIYCFPGSYSRQVQLHISSGLTSYHTLHLAKVFLGLKVTDVGGRYFF
jgi:hypothetical protein